VIQQGQVFKLKATGSEGTPLWAYRYHVGGRGGTRVQYGGLASGEDARAALERALEKRRPGRAGGNASTAHSASAG
jgi:hypothetical protein